jgi:hypothetical protein
LQLLNRWLESWKHNGTSQKESSMLWKLAWWVHVGDHGVGYSSKNFSVKIKKAKTKFHAMEADQHK